MSMKEAVTSVLTQYANFDGRARRSEYWYFTLFEAIVTGVLAGLGSAFFGSDSTMNIFTVLSSLFSLAVFIPGLAVTWRRLHDFPVAPARFFFLTLIPVVRASFCLSSSARTALPGDNRFGPNPKGSLLHLMISPVPITEPAARLCFYSPVRYRPVEVFPSRLGGNAEQICGRSHLRLSGGK